MITKDMLISEILEQKEEAASVLMANGMGCLVVHHHRWRHLAKQLRFMGWILIQS